MRTYREWVDAARALEKRARWTEAAAAWDEARRASKTRVARAGAAGARAAAEVRAGATPAEPPPAPPPPAAASTRASRAGLVPGQVLKHERGGLVLAECLYRGEREWLYGGEVYMSPSYAANAAAATLGMRSRTLNGWLFWGIERRVRR